MDRERTTTIKRGSEAYPHRLERLPDPPEELHVMGEIPTASTVAIVGSRKTDADASRFTYRLAGALAREGVAVISGGAQGIDTAAHSGAVEAGGSTVAVIGSGFDFLYPESNKALFESIAESGALVTEYRREQPPTRWTFPRRNRLIAALADAVVVVRASERSGALITARFASELGVPLCAVPGPAGDSYNRGNHGLLRKGAHMVESAADVLSLLSLPREKRQLDLPGATRDSDLKSAEIRVTHSPLETKILEILCRKPVHIDAIMERLGASPGDISSAILELELQGLVVDRGGKNFARVE